MQINGPALRAIRERSGLTQTELAEAAESSQARVSTIEAKDVIGVRPSTAKRLAEALHVPLTAITVPEQAVAS